MEKRNKLKFNIRYIPDDSPFVWNSVDDEGLLENYRENFSGGIHHHQYEIFYRVLITYFRLMMAYIAENIISIVLY